MDKNVLKTVISDNMSEVPKYKVNLRDIRFEDAGNYVLTGMRRAGKSYLLYQRMQQLMADGIKPQEMLYVNFEDERLSGMKLEDLNLLLETHMEMYGITKPILFLDEIQNIDGWEKFARRLADTKHRVYITGSNAKMLSKDIQTTLGGRYIAVDVYPYNFREYLKAGNVKFSGDSVFSTHGKAAILRKYNDYLRFGGLPESLLFSSKRDYLNSLYQKIYLGDIAARHSVDNLQALRVLFKKLAESVGQPLSYNRIANIVSSTGAKISVNTIINYIEYAKDARLVIPMQNIAGKIAEKESRPKYYFTDNGILNLFLIDPVTALFENLVAVSLLRKFGCDDSVFFYNRDMEVDFYLPQTATAIQACYSLDTSGGTLDRETGALLKLPKLLKCKRRVILTDNVEKSITAGGKKIEVIPLWKWLLEQ